MVFKESDECDFDINKILEMKVIALALFGLVLTQAVFVKRSSDPHAAVFAQLESMEDHELGRKLLDTIAL